MRPRRTFLVLVSGSAAVVSVTLLLWAASGRHESTATSLLAERYETTGPPAGYERIEATDHRANARPASATVAWNPTTVNDLDAPIALVVFYEGQPSVAGDQLPQGAERLVFEGRDAMLLDDGAHLVLEWDADRGRLSLESFHVDRTRAMAFGATVRVDGILPEVDASTLGEGYRSRSTDLQEAQTVALTGHSSGPRIAYGPPGHEPDTMNELTVNVVPAASGVFARGALTDLQSVVIDGHRGVLGQIGRWGHPATTDPRVPARYAAIVIDGDRAVVVTAFGPDRDDLVRAISLVRPVPDDTWSEYLAGE